MLLSVLSLPALSRRHGSNAAIKNNTTKITGVIFFNISMTIGGNVDGSFVSANPLSSETEGKNPPCHSHTPCCKTLKQHPAFSKAMPSARCQSSENEGMLQYLAQKIPIFVWIRRGHQDGNNSTYDTYFQNNFVPIYTPGEMEVQVV